MRAARAVASSAALGLSLAACGAPPGEPSPDTNVSVIEQPSLCVTEGAAMAVQGAFLVTQPRMRAVVAYESLPVVEARFTYVGPTEVVALQSGITIRQIGLKLRAQDDCNLVYVRWIIEPTPRFSVEVKRNPGLTTSSQCGDAGYLALHPTHVVAPPDMPALSTHVLHAEAVGDTVEVWADGALVWSGALPESARDLAGPTGIRSDNVSLSFALFSAPPAADATAPTCGPR